MIIIVYIIYIFILCYIVVGVYRILLCGVKY